MALFGSRFLLSYVSQVDDGLSLGLGLLTRLDGLCMILIDMSRPT